MSEKLFTTEEVENLIPRLEQIMSGVMEQKRSAMELGQQLSEMQEQIKAGNSEAIEAADVFNKQTELEFFVRIINESLQSIEDLGGQPKDLDIGLVDFPAIIDDEEVLLCWKYGEKHIEFYHGITEGYAGRKPIPHGRN